MKLLSLTCTDSEYKVAVITHGDKGSGTEAQVTLTVFGERRDTGPQPLSKPGAFKDGATDEFTVSSISPM